MYIWNDFISTMTRNDKQGVKSYLFLLLGRVGVSDPVSQEFLVRPRFRVPLQRYSYHCSSLKTKNFTSVFTTVGVNRV